MKNFTEKFVKKLNQIWGDEIKKHLNASSFLFPGKNLRDLKESELSCELSMVGHQCLFSKI